jgi:hypothetical protein
MRYAMKGIQKFVLPVLLSAALIIPVHAAQTAQARMYCVSLRFQQGVDDMGFYTLDLSTLDLSGLPNGELAPTYTDPSHFSGFRLYDQIWETTVEGEIAFDVPTSQDANQDGFNDFFEVGQGVSGTTTGVVSIPALGDSGTVQATWSRAAGAKDGTCIIRMTTGQFGQLSPMTHAFELIEYGGPLSYAPGTNRVTGTVDLRQTGAPDNRFTGPADWLKAPSDRFNQLELQPGSWTNGVGDSLPFLADDFQRDTVWTTNYYGYFDFVDGDLSTLESDYTTWVLSIDDANDADKDGIPDFSDDPGASPPRAPTLAVSLTGSTVVFTVRGTVGRLHELQEATSLSSKDWATVQSVTLSTDPQTVSVARPAEGARFWRLRVPP